MATIDEGHYVIEDDAFEQIIYSGQAKHRLKLITTLKSTGDEYESYPDEITEKVVFKKRITPADGSGTFCLNNFVTQEVNWTLHSAISFPTSSNLDNITYTIYLGTLIDNDYEYQKMGVYNVYSLNAKDNGKFEMVLKDNSILLDKKYNASSVIEINGGKATLKQILEDICSQCGVEISQNPETNYFDGYDEEFNFVDSSITGRNYIGYIAEQAGCFPTINRDGKLEFIKIRTTGIRKIPLEIIEKYDVGELYYIGKVLYEDGIRKFEGMPYFPVGSQLRPNDILYIDTKNPFISSKYQITGIGIKTTDFKYRSLKTGKVLGNPKIEPYEFVEFDVPLENNQVEHIRSLANHTLTYNGVLTMEFDTKINKEKMKENVTKTGEATFQRWARTEVDNLNNLIREQVSNTQQNTELINDLNGTVEAQRTLIEQTTQTITAQGEQIEVLNTNIQNINGNVTEVTTTTGYTFNKDGLHIEKSDSPNSSTLDEKGFEVDNKSGASSNVQLYAGVVDDNIISKEDSLSDYKGQSLTYTSNIVFNKYLATGNGRMENVHNTTYGDGIGFFV